KGAYKAALGQPRGPTRLLWLWYRSEDCLLDVVSHVVVGSRLLRTSGRLKQPTGDLPPRGNVGGANTRVSRALVTAVTPQLHRPPDQI
ncbi:MAG TPA: hypothetical protein VKM54_14695, partial [Myxococcota bacterium]|nr:hypothetical protein [Myxococcota bacterium]